MQGSGHVVDDFEQDFDDGVKLCALVESLQNRKIGKVIKKPINQHQSLENVTLALKAIAEDNVRLVNIGSEDIVNGSLKLILGLVWHLILRYQIGKTKFPPKKLMLAWLQAVIPECHIGNFTSDWNDGVALRLENCQNAMTIAREKLNIPMVVRPEDFSSPHLDDLSGMTYLSYYMMPDSPGYYATRREIRKILQSGTIDNFTVSILSLDAAQRQLSIEPIFSAQEMADPEVEHLGVMAYAAYFTKLRPVKLSMVSATFDGNMDNAYVGKDLDVTSDGKSISGCPVSFRVVADRSRVTYYPVERCAVGALTELKVDASNAGQGDLRMEARSPSGHTMYPDPIYRQGRYTSNFTPNEVGTWEISVLYDGDHISGSPYTVQVFDPLAVRVYGLDGGAVGRALTFNADATQAGDGDMKVKVTYAGSQVPSHIIPEGNGEYKIDFTPQGPGQYTVNVFMNDVEVRGSPYTLDIVDSSQVTLSGEGLSLVPVDRPTTFTIHTKGAGSGNVTVDIAGPRGKKVPVKLREINKETVEVEYTPVEAGDHKINVRFFGQLVKGSPYVSKAYNTGKLIVSDMPQWTLPGNPVSFHNPDDNNVPYELTSDSAGDLQVTYTPRVVGDHTINVQYSGQAVAGSPFTAKAYNAGAIIVTPLADGFVGQPLFV
nr:hypothetical protein BaRGS_007581 [Batillaria attramentaria]